MVVVVAVVADVVFVVVADVVVVVVLAVVVVIFVDATSVDAVLTFVLQFQYTSYKVSSRKT